MNAATPFSLYRTLNTWQTDQESLAEDLARRQKIQEDEGATTAGCDRDGERDISGRALTTVAITCRSFQIMQTRALEMFQHSLASLQALRDGDFQDVAELLVLEGRTAGPGVVHTEGDEEHTIASKLAIEVRAGEVDDHHDEGEPDPMPSLSTFGKRHLTGDSTSSSSSANNKETGSEETANDRNGEGGGGGDSGQRKYLQKDEGGEFDEKDPLAHSYGDDKRDTAQDIRMDNGRTCPDGNFSHHGIEEHEKGWVTAAAALRVLRATVVVLGGCGLGPLPSDKDLWVAVRPMLLDGSLRHRIRHMDRCVHKMH